MQNNTRSSLKKIFLGGFIVIGFYFVATWLYAMSIPASSGLAGGFAIGYFAIFLAVFIPVLGGFFYLFSMGETEYTNPSNKNIPAQAQTTENRISHAKIALLISLFPLLSIILMMIIMSVFKSFGRSPRDSRALEPTGDYNFIVPGDPSQIRNY